MSKKCLRQTLQTPKPMRSIFLVYYVAISATGSTLVASTASQLAPKEKEEIRGAAGGSAVIKGARCDSHGRRLREKK